MQSATYNQRTKKEKNRKGKGKKEGGEEPRVDLNFCTNVEIDVIFLQSLFK